MLSVYIRLRRRRDRERARHRTQADKKRDAILQRRRECLAAEEREARPQKMRDRVAGC